MCLARLYTLGNNGKNPASDFSNTIPASMVQYNYILYYIILYYIILYYIILYYIILYYIILYYIILYYISSSLSLSLSVPLREHQKYYKVYCVLWPVCIVTMVVKAPRCECGGVCGWWWGSQSHPCNYVINCNFVLYVSYPAYCDTDEEISHVSVNSGHFCCHSVSRDLIVISIFSLTYSFVCLTDINVTFTRTSCTDLN